MADIKDYITKEDNEAFTKGLNDLISTAMQSASSPQELVEAVEHNTYETELQGDDGYDDYDDGDDEQDECLMEKEREACNKYHEDGTHKTEQELKEEVDAGVEIKKNWGKVIPFRGRDAKPATPEMIDKAFAEQKMFDSISQSLLNFSKQIESEEMQKQKAVEAQKKWTDIPIAYKSGCYTDADGKEVQVKKELEPVDWGEVLSKKAGSPDEAIERLRSFITFSIRKKYGSWSRIKSIVVRSEQLIINDTMYVPVIEKKYINSEIFPVDTLDYIQNGCIAQFFNWEYLKSMSNLYSLDIDDVNFYTSTVGADLKIGRRIGVGTVFNTCHSLDILTLGSETVTREKLLTKESVPIKEKVNTSKRFWNFNDGYKLNICKGTNGLQDFTLNNLKNYATNRGNKGLFRYCLGTMARASLFAGAGVANLASHLAWGVKNLFSTAMTPVTEEDLNQ